MMDFRKRSLPSLEFSFSSWQPAEEAWHDNHRHQNPFFCIHLNGTNQINIPSNGQMWIIMMKMTFCIIAIVECERSWPKKEGGVSSILSTWSFLTIKCRLLLTQLELCRVTPRWAGGSGRNLPDSGNTKSYNNSTRQELRCTVLCTNAFTSLVVLTHSCCCSVRTEILGIFISGLRFTH